MANLISVSGDEMSDNTISESSDNNDYSDSESGSLDSSPASPGTTSSCKAPYIRGLLVWFDSMVHLVSVMVTLYPR